MPAPAARADARPDAVLETLDALEGLERFQAFRAGAPASGAWGSSAALLIAALARQGPPRLVVTPTVEEAEDFADDLQLFGLAAAEVALLPPLERFHPEAEELADPHAFSARLGLLAAHLGGRTPRVTVASVTALLGPMAPRDRLRESAAEFRPGQRVDREPLIERLVSEGFVRVPRVQLPQELAVRGDILDLFPLTNRHPVRVELFDDEVESIREFDPTSQRSLRELASFALTGVRRAHFTLLGAEAAAEVLACLPAGTGLHLRDPERARASAERHGASGEGLFPGFVPLAALPGRAGEGVVWDAHSVEAVGRTVDQALALLARVAARADRTVVFCASEGELRRLQRLVETNAPETAGRVVFRRGFLGQAFQLLDVRSAFLSHRELFGKVRQRREARETLPDVAPIRDWLELRERDFVVHQTHGIGRYLGVKTLEREGVREDFLEIEYRDDATLYVPVAKIDLVQRYVGSQDLAPRLSKLGGKGFARTKAEVTRAVFDFATEMLELQARRARGQGTAFGPDSELQHDFEAAFPFVDTPDQAAATAAFKRDLESPRPMDRLLCGDVGFGKTEIAMRAALKIVDGGKQVAILVPTTVLAQQHFETFSERFRDYPVVVDLISRFRSGREQRQVLERAAAGGVDILIGTHRLVQQDVAFKDLGLVIVDEEQRFGVQHKQFFHRLKSTVDLLTLTATPIPRTLHMALSGLRDISNLKTPPQGRSAIHTEVRPFDLGFVREAVLRELDREGQVYFLHNRVRSIERVRDKLAQAVPEASFAVVHGQMDEDLLEERMVEFVRGRTDVLVATTIIESGLDIPNVNTIFINDAWRFGLAELHQLRGRVGRYLHQAYAYLLVPPGQPLTPEASRRLKAIEEFSELGAGFSIAMRDLEIRGAGNILGAEQHGHIAAVGYDLYCRLLRRAVAKLKQEKTREPRDVDLNLRVSAHLPMSYVSDRDQRMEVLRRVGGARTAADEREVLAELSDRFGEPPLPVRHLVKLARVRHRLGDLRIDSLVRGTEDHGLFFRARELKRITRAVRDARARVLEKGVVYLPLPESAREADGLFAFLERLLAPAEENRKKPTEEV
jgi:transcription-repair coupling factor (superfamily II helicase)